MGDLAWNLLRIRGPRQKHSVQGKRRGWELAPLYERRVYFKEV
jgi:hypothetical protein